MADRRRLGNPEILADLGSNRKAGHRVANEELADAERHLVEARDVDGNHIILARYEVTSLVELVVRGDILLGHDAQDLSSAEGDRAVVELGVHADRRSDEDEGIELCGLLCEVFEAVLDRSEQGALHEEVLAGVSRKAQLGKHHYLAAVRAHRGRDGVDA